MQIHFLNIEKKTFIWLKIPLKQQELHFRN